MEDTYSVIGFNGNKEVFLAKKVSFQEAIRLSVDNDSNYEKVNIVEDYELLYKAENLLIVSDCNMLLKETKTLLDRPESLNEQFIFLGNFVSDGPGFYQYMRYLVSLKKKKQKNCVFIKGKNEHNILEYIHQTNNYVGCPIAVFNMISSIEKELTFSLFCLKEKFPLFYELLNDALPFYENDQYILVSGGLDLSSQKWRESSPEDLYLTSNDFLFRKNITNKTIIFGNKKVQDLHANGVTRPWINDSQKKIGINGDCIHEHKLIALLAHEKERFFIGVRHRNARKISYAY